ncbi:hypothetical protein [Spirochaeta cellobiosiphila]|uniref:hypothetical protein n=1 Tax=Spirochaeta cellobiosiphila TaxID=504483 RepID=UPI001B7FC9A9|nr:hypothetical protein [Spirochaeta cellobiosiphila]
MALIFISTFLLSCDLMNPKTPTTPTTPSTPSHPNRPKEIKKLTLYKPEVAIQTPNHLVFEESITFDGRTFNPNNEPLTWNIKYEQDYNAAIGKFGEESQVEKEVVTYSSFDYTPPASGYYRISLYREGVKVAIGRFIVTRNPFDNSAPPTAKLNIHKLPDRNDKQIHIDAVGSKDDADTVEELRYRWNLMPISLDTFMRYQTPREAREVLSDKLHGTEKVWKEKLSIARGLYYVQLVVQDKIYDRARESFWGTAPSEQYTQFYIAPKGQPIDLQTDPMSFSIKNYDTDIPTMHIGDFFWYEIVRNTQRFEDIMIIYMLRVGKDTLLRYGVSTFDDPGSKVGYGWTEDTILITHVRDDFRAIEIPKLTSEELNYFTSPYGGFNTDGYAFETDTGYELKLPY